MKDFLFALLVLHLIAVATAATCFLAWALVDPPPDRPAITRGHKL